MHVALSSLSSSLPRTRPTSSQVRSSDCGLSRCSKQRTAPGVLTIILNQNALSLIQRTSKTSSMRINVHLLVKIKSAAGCHGLRWHIGVPHSHWDITVCTRICPAPAYAKARTYRTGAIHPGRCKSSWRPEGHRSRHIATIISMQIRIRPCTAIVGIKRDATASCKCLASVTSPAGRFRVFSPSWLQRRRLWL